MSNNVKDVDLTNADGPGVWLVKIPKYIAKRWEKAPGNIEVAKLQITKRPEQKAELALNLSDKILAMKEPGEPDIPREHEVVFTNVQDQTLGVFSHAPATHISQNIEYAKKVFFDGKVVHKLECRPQASQTYMNLKIASIKEAAMPKRKIQLLDRPVINFKPISDHKNNIVFDVKKKAEGKRRRDDKGLVLKLLMAAFEKHQYYSIRDLVGITKQPVVYLKEILNEYCKYNVKNRHKNMWELKPEYRHYKEEKAKQEFH